jgi:hypothetical protein
MVEALAVSGAKLLVSGSAVVNALVIREARAGATSLRGENLEWHRGGSAGSTV